METDAPCEVGVLGGRARTFSVAGHHYALVVIGGLPGGEAVPYEVFLDGERAWPEPDSPFPASTIRPPRPGEQTRIVFGSCRVSAPHQPPFTRSRDQDARGQGPDALRAFALRSSREPPERRPQLLLLLGDQIYACLGAPATRAFIRSRRQVEEPPGEEPADFEEYARLYQESWQEPALRWLLSTVSVAMVACDHDLCEDWNTSAAWVREMQATSWWAGRERGGIIAYWLYQHLGNLSPAELAEDPVYEALSTGAEGEQALQAFAAHASRVPDARRFSWTRQLGGVRVVAIDTRTGRVLAEGHRAIVDDAAWAWVEQQASGDIQHLVLASSLPFVMPEALHYLEAWNEALCAGAWGRAAARMSERLRRRLSLEHWPAFQASFARLATLLEHVTSDARGQAPGSVIMVSGDLHQGYLANVAARAVARGDSRIYQVVCSPLRHPLTGSERRMIRVVNSWAGRVAMRALARLAGVGAAPLRWRLVDGPIFHNQIATLDFRDSVAHLALETAPTVGEDRDAVLETMFARPLSGDAARA